MRRRRRAHIGIVASFGLLAAMAGSQASATEMAPKDRAYTLALMCYAFASEYGTEADGLRTQEAVSKMGRAQGYSRKRISSDSITMASVVGVQIRDDPSSVERNRAICRKLKLIS